MLSLLNSRLTIFLTNLLFVLCTNATAMDVEDSVAAARGSVQVLLKAEIKKINKVTGYGFQNKDLLQAAFVHSSLSGNTTFEKLESLGDGLIKGIVTDSLNFESYSSEAAMHEAAKAKTNNAHFAARYEALGLSKFLKANPDALSDESSAVGGPGYKKAYADGLEALVGAIKLDWEAQHPKLRAKGRVFAALTPIVRKMLLLDEPTPLVKAVAAPKSAKTTIAAVAPKVKAKVVTVKAVDVSSSVAAAKPKKMRAVVTVSSADGRVIATRKAKGESEAAARLNTIRITGFWEGLELPACKPKKRKWESFLLECQKKGYSAAAKFE